jgi:hypothetical protein
VGSVSSFQETGFSKAGRWISRIRMKSFIRLGKRGFIRLGKSGFKGLGKEVF